MKADCRGILFPAILYVKVKNFDKLDNTYESEQRHTLTHVFSRGSE